MRRQGLTLCRAGDAADTFVDVPCDVALRVAHSLRLPVGLSKAKQPVFGCQYADRSMFIAGHCVTHHEA